MIAGNSASSGGGVFATNIFRMSGGTITGNKITEGLGGGGVSLANDETSVMNLSGSPIIQGNTLDGAENNLFIRSGGAVNIVDSRDCPRRNRSADCPQLTARRAFARRAACHSAGKTRPPFM